MRIWLLVLASCWTGPVAPPPVAPVASAALVVARPALRPGGYFVPGLIAHRLETHGIDDVGGELAAFQPRLNGPIRVVRMVDATSIRVPFPSNLPSDSHLVVEYCIDITGRVTSAHVQGVVPAFPLSGVPSDQNVVERMRGWRFAPYFVDGKPVMACSYIDYSAIAP